MKTTFRIFKKMGVLCGFMLLCLFPVNMFFRVLERKWKELQSQDT